MTGARFFGAVNVLRTEQREGQTVYVLELQTENDGGAVVIYVDIGTGDVVELETTLVDATSSVGVSAQVLFEDYRDVEGVRIPFRIITSNPVAGRAIIQFDEVAVRLERDNELFTPLAKRSK